MDLAPSPISNHPQLHNRSTLLIRDIGTLRNNSHRRKQYHIALKKSGGRTTKTAFVVMKGLDQGTIASPHSRHTEASSNRHKNNNNNDELTTMASKLTATTPPTIDFASDGDDEEAPDESCMQDIPLDRDEETGCPWFRDDPNADRDRCRLCIKEIKQMLLLHGTSLVAFIQRWQPLAATLGCYSNR